ncbi:fimbrial protein [Escherichia coli]|nr:fimbrial protein [Escherichia coli]
MKGKLVLLMVGALAVGCSQSALADCKVDNPGVIEGLYNGNVWLNYTKHDAPDPMIVSYRVGDGFASRVKCNKDGGWIELEMVSPNGPAGVYDAQKTSVPGVGVKLTADIAKNDFSGTESVVLTNGSFTSRRWEIPASEDTLPRYFTVAKYPMYEFWAIGPKDPKAGSFGGQPILEVRAGGDGGLLSDSVVFGFSSTSQTIATCNVPSTSELSFTMRTVMANHLAEDQGEHGGLGRLNSTKVTQAIGPIRCDSDLNVQFTISDTGNLHPGTDNVLDSVKGDGYTEGLGATFRYKINEDGETSEENKVDVIFGQPMYLRNGDIDSVSPKLSFYLFAYYYRFGDIKPGQFQSTAVLNIKIQ